MSSRSGKQIDFYDIGSYSLERVLMAIRKGGTEFVRFELGDLYGISRSKIIPTRHFAKKSASGIRIPLAQLLTVIDGSAFQFNTPYRNGIIGSGDATWFPVLETFRVLPWYNSTASVLVEPTHNDEPATFYPRHIATKHIKRLGSMGLSLLAAHEHEFYVIDRKTGLPLTRDMCLRATLRNFTDYEFMYQLMKDLHKVGIDVETFDTETGQGQMEITYKPAFGIKAADNAFRFRTTVKEIAQKHGYVASFMTKPFPDQIGSSAHLNHSLWNQEGTRNMLYNPGDTTGLSEIGRQWMAGILNHARAISMLMAPTVNCYRRGKESYLNNQPRWGIDNRSCMLRVKINGPQGTFIENRSAGSGSNPYLTLAAIIAAGIDGIDKKRLLPPGTEGLAFEVNNRAKETNTNMPSNLQEAMDAFRTDDVIQGAFGYDFCEAFCALKSFELAALHVKSDDEESYLAHRKLFFEYM